MQFIFDYFYRYSRIIASDLSPSMLAETKRRIINEKLPLPDLVRCDSARLPFKNDLFDGIHAGAALHCWPRVDISLEELFRVLKPNGVVYASTILTTELTKDLSGFMLFESTDKLKELFENAGFKGDKGTVEVRKEGRNCAIIKARKFKN